jgi:hypothetical protein
MGIGGIVDVIIRHVKTQVPLCQVPLDSSAFGRTSDQTLRASAMSPKGDITSPITGKTQWIRRKRNFGVVESKRPSTHHSRRQEQPAFFGRPSRVALICACRWLPPSNPTVVGRLKAL